jgi:hypothetical protein
MVIAGRNEKTAEPRTLEDSDIPMREHLLILSGTVRVACLALAGVCAWAQTAERAEKSCPSPPPAFPGMTFDEDDLYLANPKCRTEALDRLKYVPLRSENEDYYLSFGVWIRERGEFFSNPNWGNGPPGNAYPMQRYYLHTDFHLGDRLRFFGELGTSVETGRNGGPRPGLDTEKLYVHQGFFDIGLAKWGKNSVALRAGQQEMSFGSHYLISPRDGRNIRRSFTGVRLTSLVGDWTVDAFAVRRTLDNPGYFDNPPEHKSSFWGVYAVRPFQLLPRGNIDLYYLGLDDKQIVVDARGAGREQRETAGARLWGKTPRWDYDNELTFQWGSFQSDNIRAWAVTTEVGYRFDSILFHPRFGVRENAFSGNQNPSSHTIGTFNSLYQTGPYFSYAELFGNRNLVAVQPSVELNLSKTVSLTPNVAVYWRESPRDALYSASGGLVVSGQGSRARYVGSHASVQLQWKINRHTTAFTEYLHFFPGDFLKQSTAGRNINYLTEWLDFRF